jgi:hypothetical protein
MRMRMFLNTGFEFQRLKINNPKNKFIVFNVTYKLYHKGLEGQKAYYTLCSRKGKIFYVEIVDHPSNGWSYFAETKDKPLFSSLIEKKNYFNTAEEAHKAIFKRLNTLFK